MGRSLAMNAARRVRRVVSGQSVHSAAALLKQTKPYNYERVGLSKAEGRSTRTLRLGGKSRVRIAGLQEILHSPSSLISRLRASYDKFLDAAKETNVNLHDLFVSNQMLGQVCATPLRTFSKKASVPARVPHSGPILPRVASQRHYRAGRTASFRC